MTIAARDLTQLMNQARVKLTGVSDAALKGELYDVLTEFFEDSSAWLETVTVAVNAGTSLAQIPISDGQIVRLASVVDGNGLPVGAQMPTIGELVLFNTPNEDIALSVTVVKNVSLPNTKDHVPVAPDWVLPRWHNGILDGLLGKMMTQQNKSYSDQTLGVYHLRRFRDAIAKARVATLRANAIGTQAWRYPRTFASSSQISGTPTWGNGRVM